MRTIRAGRRKKTKPFPVIFQQQRNDCGIACMKMIASYYDPVLKDFDFTSVAEPGKSGLTMETMETMAAKAGLNLCGVKLTVNQLCRKKSLPAIILLAGQHYTLIPPGQKSGHLIRMIDPAVGLVFISESSLARRWYTDYEGRRGYALIFNKRV